MKHRWIENCRVDSYLWALLRARGEDETVLDREIARTLLILRWQRAIQPYVGFFKKYVRLLQTAWRYIHGRYRGARPPVYQHPLAPSGAAFGGAFTATGTGFAFPNPPAAPAAPAAPTAPIPNAGIRTGEVVAYRCWILKDGLLYSAYQSEFVWPPGEVVEGDPHDDYEGIHGFKDRLSACQYIQLFEDAHARGIFSHLEVPPDASIVSGTVALWGTIVEHERGYRASYAAVKSIDDSPNYDDAAIRKTYKLNRKRKVKRDE